MSGNTIPDGAQVPLIVPAILAGGSGTRLWPLSRELHPKQFLSLLGERTMLQLTLDRLAGIDGLDEPIVVCNHEHRFLVAQQLQSAATQNAEIVLEPCGRNTAPAVAIAAMRALERAQSALLLVVPADHAVHPAEQFRRCITDGVEAAQGGAFVTFGVSPKTAETGYGYVKAAAPSEWGAPVYRVEHFVEKPPLNEASEYLLSGSYYWNSGVFLFSAAAFLDELERHAPDILASCRSAYEECRTDLDFLRLGEEPFSDCRSESVDKAVLEKTDRAVLVPMKLQWSDVGSWAALGEAVDMDPDGNVSHGDVMLEDTRDSYIRSEKRLVAAIGVRDHVVVETSDAVLVAPKDRVQDVKHIVDRLRQEGRAEVMNHRRVERPWGSYESISVADRFQVKHIVVKPGARLSLQMHHHRAEHWVVVRGTAEVTCGEKVFLLSEDESTYVPLGTRHCLENKGLIPLELIEVQTGSYLGEDDIIRFNDLYGR
jgi:mannose-1-phosphate guanylyltransferase/mannose-6-phosphate isomerase